MELAAKLKLNTSLELITKHGVILEKTERAFEELGVLNPAIYQDGNNVHMFYRAAKRANFSTIVMEPKYDHETSHIGPGAPPIETPDGWLLIYHSAERREKGLVYHASAVLLDLQNPQKVLARLPKPIITPSEYYERHGYVNYVVFPTGTAIFYDQLYIYYGAADDKIAVASLNLNDLLTELKQNPHENDIK